MDPLLIATGVAVFAGAALQAATGFGFALLAAPLAFAALDPHEAIGLLLLLGMEIGVLTLAHRGSPAAPDGAAVRGRARVGGAGRGRRRRRAAARSTPSRCRSRSAWAWPRR